MIAWSLERRDPRESFDLLQDVNVRVHVSFRCAVPIERKKSDVEVGTGAIQRRKF